MPGGEQVERRVLTHLDVWSVAKLAFLFFVVIGVIWIAAGAILWNVLSAFGWIDKVESFAGTIASGDFGLEAGKVFRAGATIVAVFVLGFTLMTALLAVIYNLIADVVGGITIRVADKVEDKRGFSVTDMAVRVRAAQRRSVAQRGAKQAPPLSAEKVVGPRKPAATGARPAAAQRSAPRRRTGTATAPSQQPRKAKVPAPSGASSSRRPDSKPGASVVNPGTPRQHPEGSGTRRAAKPAASAGKARVRIREQVTTASEKPTSRARAAAKTPIEDPSNPSSSGA